MLLKNLLKMGAGAGAGEKNGSAILQICQHGLKSTWNILWSLLVYSKPQACFSLLIMEASASSLADMC